MAKTSVLSNLTGHIANWATNSGLTGKAKKALGSRANRIDAAVNAATSGSSSQSTKKKWPWQSK